MGEKVLTTLQQICDAEDECNSNPEKSNVAWWLLE